MELRETYIDAHAANTALQCCMQNSCAANPGDMLVWDRGTSSRTHSRANEWPALLISFKIVAFSAYARGNTQLADAAGRGRCAILAFALTANGQLRFFNARFVRRPKGMKSVSTSR